MEEEATKLQNNDKVVQETDYVINLRTKDAKTVFGSFFNTIMANLSGDSFDFFTKYASFLIFEAENFLGALMMLYSFIYTRHFDQRNSLMKMVVLQNYLDIGLGKLHFLYKGSNFWLSQRRIFDVYEFNKKLDSV